MAAKTFVVIGGGAAGFFCALNAAAMNPALQVILLEKSNKLLSKVKISGGGRCNVTHACFDIDTMSSRYPRGRHFIKKAFHRFFTSDTIKWFEERGVKLKTEEDGRMFPVTDSSQTIIDCLLREASKRNVDIRMNAEVKKISRDKNGLFVVELAGDKTIAADLVCIASGGYPKDAMFDWIRETGHSIEPPVPSLFTFNLPGHPITKLMGVSVKQARVRIKNTKLEQEGPILITHWGLSGPAVLKSSAWGAKELAACHWNFSITINWLGSVNEESARKEISVMRQTNPSQKILNGNIFNLPQRLWEFFLEQTEIPTNHRWADLRSEQLNKLVKNLVAFEADVKGKTTFKEEFVTAGGISLKEIDPNTMMSKKIDGLFFAGEIMDVDGITGGYNFQHAWTSGYIAGISAAERSR